MAKRKRYTVFLVSHISRPHAVSGCYCHVVPGTPADTRKGSAHTTGKKSKRYVREKNREKQFFLHWDVVYSNFGDGSTTRTTTKNLKNKEKIKDQREYSNRGRKREFRNKEI